LEPKVQIRDALGVDELGILEIRNHPDNLIWFFSTSPITLQNHKTWFSERLMNSQFFTLVALAGDELIGVAYLSDLISNTPKVSISIKPGSKALGIGTKLLKELITRSKSANFKLMFAEIKNTNKASILFFQKNGFVMCSLSSSNTSQSMADFVTLCFDLTD
jgi:L-amino acid N-acyltransferase YncA